MLLKIDGTNYEIDTVVNMDGGRWVSLWKGNLLVDSSFLTVDEAVDAVDEIIKQEMRRFSEAIVEQTLKAVVCLSDYVGKKKEYETQP